MSGIRNCMLIMLAIIASSNLLFAQKQKALILLQVGNYRFDVGIACLKNDPIGAIVLSFRIAVFHLLLNGYAVNKNVLNDNFLRGLNKFFAYKQNDLDPVPFTAA